MNVDGDTPKVIKYSIKDYILLASFILDETRCIKSYAHNNTHIFTIYTQKDKPGAQIILSNADLQKLPWLEFTQQIGPHMYALTDTTAVTRWLQTLDPTITLEYLL